MFWAGVRAGLKAAAKWTTAATIIGGVGTFCYTIAPEVKRIRDERAARIKGK